MITWHFMASWSVLMIAIFCVIGLTGWYRFWHVFDFIESSTTRGVVKIRVLFIVLMAWFSVAVISLMTSFASILKFHFDSSNFILDGDDKRGIKLASFCVVITRKWTLLTTRGAVVITSWPVSNHCCWGDNDSISLTHKHLISIWL